MKNNKFAVTAVMIVGIVLALVVLRINKPEEQAHEEGNHEAADTDRGPHGGRRFSKEAFQLEVTIYENGVLPQFRVYPFEKGRPIDPGTVKLMIALHRLGGRVDEIVFHKEGGYLAGNKTVEEPHSFDVKITAEWKGETYRWEYSQVENRIEMFPEVARASGITVATAGPVRMKTVLELPGEIRLNQNRVAHVVPRVAGVVAAVYKNLGDRVTKGEVIALLDSRELADLKGDYLAATKRVELARANFEREDQLFRKKISAEQDFLAARQALVEAEIAAQAARQKLLALGLSKTGLSTIAEAGTENLTRYELRAPIDGIIVEKEVTAGEAIKEDADIFVIADLSTVWGDITVYAKDLRVVRIGQRVTIRSKELGLTTTGKVSYLGSLVGEKTRSALAHVDIPNPKGLWRPGLFVTVELIQEEVPVAVAVAADAIQRFRDWDVVFVQYDHQFEARPLTLGRNDGQWVEVISGLAAGERYASQNSFVLKAELGKEGATHDH